VEVRVGDVVAGKEGTIAQELGESLVLPIQTSNVITLHFVLKTALKLKYFNKTNLHLEIHAHFLFLFYL